MISPTNTVTVALAMSTTSGPIASVGSLSSNPSGAAMAMTMAIHTPGRSLASDISSAIASENVLIDPADLIMIPLMTATADFSLEISAAASSNSSSRIDAEAIEACYTLSSDQKEENGDTSGSCGEIMTAISACYSNNGPWNDPYDQEQSLSFQFCFCDTDPSTTFNSSSPLWSNFTTCASCLASNANLPFPEIWQQQQRFQNFCSSPEPLAYLFIQRLRRWLGGQQLPTPVLSGQVLGIESLLSQFTTTPPLANIAYGSHAPADGRFAAVTPVLTTLTTWSADPTNSDTSRAATITRVASWVPTAPGAIGFGPEDSTESVIEELAAESRFSEAVTSVTASLSVETETGTSTSTAGRGACSGHGPCFRSDVPGASAGSRVRVGPMVVAMLVGAQMFVGLMV
ncbi:hypothetical protein MBLNU230_g4004t1 [Neophaeotheca triangularis]